jgi:hypothetical protein
MIFNFVPTREYESLLFSRPHPATEMPSVWILYKVYNPFLDPANAIDEVERLGFLSRIGIVLCGQRPRELVHKLEFCQGTAATQNIKRLVRFLSQPAPTVLGSMLRQLCVDVKVPLETAKARRYANHDEHLHTEAVSEQNHTAHSAVVRVVLA